MLWGTTSQKITVAFPGSLGVDWNCVAKMNHGVDVEETFDSAHGRCLSKSHVSFCWYRR